MDVSSELARALTEALAGSTFRLERAWAEPGRLCMTLGDPTLVLEVRPAVPGQRAYVVVDGLAFSYRGSVLPTGIAGALEQAIRALARPLAGWSPDTVTAPAGPSNVPFPTPRQAAHLDDRYVLSSAQRAAFRRDGHLLVRRAVDPEVVRAARRAIEPALARSWPKDLPPAARRADAYARSFTQIVDLGLVDPVVRAFTHARRFAALAADLMGVEGVQLFCEDWLIKEPGADLTPWHQDEAVFPFDAEHTITCWIPLGHVKEGDGLLRYARGSQRGGLAHVENISDTSEAAFDAIIAREGYPIDRLPEVHPGDVAFHHGRTIHGALPNTSDQPRLVLALHCFAAGARIKAPTTPTMANVLGNAAPDATIGAPAVSARWPSLPVERRRVSLPSQSQGPRFHLSVVPLPEDAPTDLWIVDGRIRHEPVDRAEPLPGGFALPGLVDAHCHISYPHTEAEPVDTEAWMNARRGEHASTGVLLLRDMGAVSDAICGLSDVPGLPPVLAAGNMILRHAEWPFRPTAPERLVDAFRERVASGAAWVKVFADWSSDYRGRENDGFSGSDATTYPLELLREATDVAHALGARVAAHCYTPAGAALAIAAGVDSLEHGWGVDEGLIERMAERDITWVPLAGIATSMWHVARRDGQIDRMRWFEASMVALSRLLPYAHARGVRIVAGTDRFPTVTIPDEIRQLIELGLDPAAAVGAGTWTSRRWLGAPGLEDGAPADLVVYADDPRRDPAVLLRPTLVLSGGVRVTPSFHRTRPRFHSWAEREHGSPS